MKSPAPSLALAPMVFSRPPTMTVGSKPPASRTRAVIEVVVVLPCEPATATPYFIRMSSASISARGMTGMRPARALRTSTLSSRTAEEVTTTSALLRFSARWPMATWAPRRTSRRVASFSWMSEPETL